MDTQPTGTVTFLFTDIVGSTALWDAFTDDMAAALARHDALLERTAADHNGYVFKRVGDGFCIAFDSAADALAAAIAGQNALLAEPWGKTGPIRVRMGLHTGVAEERDGDYFGPAVNRVSRIQSLSHGGQILLSLASRRLLVELSIPDIDWLDLGRHDLAGLDRAEQIYQVVVPGLPAGFPPITSRAVCPTNLPAQTTPFVGRRPELARLETLLFADTWRLITIVGPGGMGKTRLALELARRQCEPKSANGEMSALPFPDGVYFVPLAALESRTEIPPALYQALDFQPAAQDPGGRAPWQQFQGYLQSKRLMIILDNFEQLTEGAGIVAEMMAAAPDLFIVATSREQLSLRGEQLFHLGGMRYPDDIQGIDITDQLDGNSALALFIQSCQRVAPALEWPDEDLEQAVYLCRLIDGMPLAIEMAAGWVDLLPLSDIAAEIERDLDFLHSDLKDLSARHRSMTAVFDATWRRLELGDRDSFRRLSVFRGGFTRSAAREVAGVSLIQLASLSKRSLLQHDRDHDRYLIHRLLRQYGAVKLADDPEAETRVRDRHAAFYCRRLESWGPALFGSRQLEVMSHFDREIVNIRLAWFWAVERSRVDRIDQAVGALCRYYEWRLLMDESGEICRAAAEILVRLHSPESRRVLAHVLAWQGRYLPDEEDIQLLKESLALLKQAEATGQDVRAERAFVLTRLGGVTARSNYEASLAKLETALELSEHLGDTVQTVLTLAALANHAVLWGKYQDAQRYVKLQLALYQRLGDRRGLAKALNAVGIITIYQGNFEKAQNHVEQSIALCQEVGDTGLHALNLNHLGFLFLQLGRFAEARIAYEKQLSMLRDLGVFLGEPIAMISFSLTLEGRYESGYDLVDKASRRANLSPYDTGHLSWAKGGALLGLRRREEARPWLHTSACGFEQVGQLTILAGIGAILLMADTGQENMRQAVAWAGEAGSFLSHILTIPAVALHFLTRGDVTRAVELHALAASHPFVANSRWYEELVGRPISAAANELPTNVVEAAKSRGASRDLLTTIAELAAEFPVQRPAGGGDI